MFENFGNTFREAKPFFSRRIGLAKNSDGNLIQNDIKLGVRLSGKLDENWRIGVLNIQTESDEKNEIASNNNSMFAIQRMIGERSEIGAFLVNRESTKDFSFLNPCPTSGMIISGKKDELVPLQSINELKNRLSNQKGITVQFDQVADTNHFFTNSEDNLKKLLNKYIAKESSLF